MKPGEHRDTTLLEQAFSTGDMRRSPGGGCPSEDELWASAAGELNPAENQAVILHLARCSECSSIWRLAREMLPEDRLSTSAVVSIERRRRRRRWVLLPAAAAAILIAVLLGPGLFPGNDPTSTPIFRHQGRGFEIVASESTRALTRSACKLTWSAGPAGTRYDLIVTDDELEILDTVKGLRQPEHTLPEEKIPDSARELFWRVTAHYPDGHTVSSDTFTSSIEGGAAEAGP